MAIAALIPFILLFVCFVGLRLPLATSAFTALLGGSVLMETVFHGSREIWNQALLNTGEITLEIGLILFGAFFFLEAAKIGGVIDSLAQLLKEVNTNRVVQGVLLTFPVELMIEGSSGFGTPLLVIAPLLMALQFDAWLCVLLPFINCFGIPFGALGTPIRLAFQNQDPSQATLLALLPLIFIAPLLTHALISKKLLWRESLWIFSMSSLYAGLSYFFSKSGPEFATLVPAFLIFIYGIFSARLIFKSEVFHPLKEQKGISVYACLLFALWIGKQLLLDRLIPGTHLRIFNPGAVFILFALLLILTNSKANLKSILKDALDRSKKTLFIFFCLTLVVQELRQNGGLALFTDSIPSFFLGPGAPILAWIGCIFIGTSTVTNLLFSKILNPAHYGVLAASTAVGVQLAFQSLAAMRSCIRDQFSEKEIFFRVAPISIGFILILTLWCNLIF